jgi:hypothetical protein
MKARTNTGGVKNLLLQHAEKIVLGVAVVLVALFLWSAIKMKPIEASKAPEQLKTQAQAQIARIEASEPKVPSAVATKLEERVAVGLEPVAPAAYSHSAKLDPETHPALSKRPEPTYFPVEDIRATGVVMSVPEQGEPPTWAEPGKEKDKKGKAKKEPKATIFDADAAKPQPAVNRRRSREGGYGGVDMPRGGRGARGGADADRGGKAGYGATGGDKAGYGATGGKAGHGGGKAGYGQTETREKAGYGAVDRGGYGGLVGAGGAHPGPPIVGVATQGVIRPAVVLTGRVPFAKQFDEYRKKFKDAAAVEGRVAESELPVYMQFKVERQEVGAGSDGNWKAIDIDEAIKAEGRWAVSPVQDEVDPVYIDPVLAWPMPPAIQRAWNRLATHPSIPFTWMADATQSLATTREAVDITALKEQRLKRVERADTQTMDGRFRVGPHSGGANDQGLGMETVAPVPSYLFRFVDTDKVEAGKQYRYRVSVEVENPNFDVDPRILQDASSSRQPSRWTPPAESPVASVPHDRVLFALSAKSRNVGLAEHQGHVLFHSWDKKMGAEVAKEFDLQLGAIADFVATVENWYNPYTGVGENLDNYHFQYEASGPTAAPMLVDIDGDSPLPGARGVDQPAEMLFVDGKGRMFTANEARDAAVAEFYKERYTVEEIAADAGTTILDQQPTKGRGGAGYGAGR